MVATATVQGALTRSEVDRALRRVVPSFRACYVAAATRAGHNAPSAIKLSFTLDETASPSRPRRPPRRFRACRTVCAKPPPGAHPGPARCGRRVRDRHGHLCAARTVAEGSPCPSSSGVLPLSLRSARLPPASIRRCPTRSRCRADPARRHRRPLDLRDRRWRGDRRARGRVGDRAALHRLRRRGPRALLGFRSGRGPREPGLSSDPDHVGRNGARRSPPIFSSIPAKSLLAVRHRVHRRGHRSLPGELITSQAALNAAQDRGLVGPAKPAPTNLDWPVVDPDVLVDLGAARPPRRRTSFTTTASRVCTSISRERPRPDHVSVPENALYELRREGGDPLSEPVRHVDLDGDGDTDDTNDIFASGLATARGRRAVTSSA